MQLILSTLVFNAEIKKLNEYQQWATLIVGAVMLSVCLVVIYQAAFRLAFAIPD